MMIMMMMMMMKLMMFKMVIVMKNIYVRIIPRCEPLRYTGHQECALISTITYATTVIFPNEGESRLFSARKQTNKKTTLSEGQMAHCVGVATRKTIYLVVEASLK